METYVIAINFFSAPNYEGNCTRYYLVKKRGKKITYAGIQLAKRYVSKSAALKTARKLSETYPTALILVI